MSTETKNQGYIMAGNTSENHPVSNQNQKYDWKSKTIKSSFEMNLQIKNNTSSSNQG